MTDPCARLRWHYTHPLAAARRAHEAGTPVIGITAGTIPSEIITAAGGFPVLLRRDAGPTPRADEYLEPGVFAPRIRGIVEGLVSGEWRFLRGVVIPRTSEQEYKLFLYLRELAREGLAPELPPVLLYDLLHARSPEAAAYGRERTSRLKEAIEAMTGRPIVDASLARAIDLSNRARRATRRLQRLRAHPPRLTGTDAVPLLEACLFMDRADYADAASGAADALETARPIDGVRLMIVGAPGAPPQLHATVESLGAVVTWEEGYGGGRCAGTDVASGTDPVGALFDHYYAHEPSPRVFPFDAADEDFEIAVAGGIDGVIFHLPPSDYIAGWDYPRRARRLEARGIPSLRLRADAAALGDDDLARLAQFVRQAAAGGT